MADFPGFPALAGVSQKAPLTARATVTETSSSGASAPAPIQATSTRSNLEHRNKGDPLLTRLLYGMLAWVSNVPLEKGYSQVDWMRRSRATNPPPLRRDITMAEVKQHRTRDDAWMVFNKKVYDITSYFKFHPGGADMLFKAAGKDGTSLFMKYHPWVNIDALMEKCLVGVLADESVSGPAGKAAVKEVEGEGIDGEGTQQGPGQAAGQSLAQTATAQTVMAQTAAGANQQGLGQAAAQTAAVTSEQRLGQAAGQQGPGHTVESNQTPGQSSAGQFAVLRGQRTDQHAGQTEAIASDGMQGFGIRAEGVSPAGQLEAAGRLQ